MYPFNSAIKSEHPFYMQIAGLCTSSFSGGVLMTPQLHKSQAQLLRDLLAQPLKRNRPLQEPLLQREVGLPPSVPSAGRMPSQSSILAWFPDPFFILSCSSQFYIIKIFKHV